MRRILKKDNSKELFHVASGLATGLLFFWLISHPKSFVKKKIPQKNLKNFSFLPNLKFFHKEKTYHFHHWLVFSSLYLPILLSKKKILPHKVLHGFVIGSIIQGLLYKDRFNIVY